MKTPLYVYSCETIRNNYQSMCSKIVNTNICYATKANSEEEVLKVLKEEGSWFECASSEEFDAVIKVGVKPEHIIFGLPIKTEDTIKHVYEKGERYFVFDELLELEKLIKWAPNANRIMRINISDIVADTIDFGISMDNVCKNENDWLKYVDGISFHISNNTNINVYRKVIKRVRDILDLLNNKRPNKYIVNIGGGLQLDIGCEFYEQMNKENEELIKRYEIELYAEPGEAIVGSAGKFYSKVILTKDNGRTIDVYLDSGIPQGFATRRKPSDVNIYGGNRIKDKRCVYRFMDCTCMGVSIFIKRKNLDIRDGDILEFECCGAYSTVFCNDFHAYDKCQIIFE